MAARKTPIPERPPILDPETQELCELMLRYPFRWFSQNTVGKACGFGEDAMTALASAGAPIVQRRCNAMVLHEWLKDNWNVVEKQMSTGVTPTKPGESR